MDDLWAEQEQVGMASINAFVIMYGGKSGDNLTKLRFVTILVFLLKFCVYLFFQMWQTFASKNLHPKNVQLR